MTTKKRGPGRPKGAPNKARMPKSEELTKLSKQGMEIGLKYMYDILTSDDDKVTEKQREMAAKVLIDIGKVFVTMEVKDDGKNKESSETREDEELPTQEVKLAKSNVYAVADYNKDK